MEQYDRTSGQKKQKIPIEEVIASVLAEEQKILAFDFVAYLKSLRMTPQWASHYSWAVSYKGKRVCYIKISDMASEARWYIRPSLQYDEALEVFCQTEGLVSHMLKNVHYCVACGKCAPGKSASFFGQHLEHVCCAPIDFEFHNPGKEELECVKKLVSYSRQRIKSEKEKVNKQKNT